MSSKILSSRSAINIIAYSGTNLVPIAVPLNCFNFFLYVLLKVYHRGYVVCNIFLDCVYYIHRKKAFKCAQSNICMCESMCQSSMCEAVETS